MNELYELCRVIFEQRCTDESVLKKKMNAHMRMRFFKKGEEIVSVFDKVKYTYLVFQGEYSEVNDSTEGVKTLLAVRTAPELIGIAYLIRQGQFFNTIMIATQDVKAIEVENDYFYHELENNGRLGILVARNLTKKLIMAHQKIRRKRFFDAAECFKIFLYEQWKISGTEQASFFIKRPNRMLADEMNFSERTLYRVLDKLTATDCITVINGDIHLNKEQINKLAAFYEEIFESIYTIPGTDI